jgi:L-asparaginase
MPKVVVVFTGGTISMRVEPGVGGAIPVLDGAAILARTPGLDAIADVEAIDWGLVPASHLGSDRLLELARAVEAALERTEVDGAVVVQGTDTIEESAFALDLLLRTEKPVAVVGAMRTADAEGYDGPVNLRDAVRAASSAELREAGVVVAMDRRIWPADDVVKLHTDAYDAFGAPNTGPLGWIDASGPVILRRRAQRRRLPSIPAEAVEPIALLTAFSGMDGRLLRLCVADGARGAVVAATGSGNTHPDLLDAAREAIGAGLPIVLATRCIGGRVQPLYAFPGGSARWFEAGAIPVGSLSAVKARLAVALGLGAGLDGSGLRDLLTDAGTRASILPR